MLASSSIDRSAISRRSAVARVRGQGQRQQGQLGEQGALVLADKSGGMRLMQ